MERQHGCVSWTAIASGSFVLGLAFDDGFVALGFSLLATGLLMAIEHRKDQR